MSEDHYLPPGPHAFESYVHRVNKTQYAMPVLSILDKLEYIFTTEGGLMSKAAQWKEFNQEYEPAGRDLTERFLTAFDEGDNTFRANELMAFVLNRKDKQ